MQQLKIIFIPGLSNGKTLGYYFVARYCKKNGIKLCLFNTKWKSAETYSSKFARLITLLDKELSDGSNVVLIGISSGGSLALNAYFERPGINKIVNVCGRLRQGKKVWPSLKWAARKSQSFKDSVLAAQANQPKMNQKQRQNILTIYGLFDETVPVATSRLPGAQNIRVFSAGHSVNIFLALAIKTKDIICI